MIIRDKQIADMLSAMTVEYHDRLARFYRRRVPQLVSRFNDTELQKRIADGVSRARSWGLYSGVAIAQCVALGLSAGPAFYEDSKVRQFMTMPGASREMKLTRLVQLTIAGLHESAKSSVIGFAGPKN